MKIEIYLEDGKPLIVFADQINYDKTIVCYSQCEEHTSATRGYLRKLAKPETEEEIAEAWRALGNYARIAA